VTKATSFLERWSIPLLLAGCVLVRGGKGLEALFISAAVVSVLFFFFVTSDKKRRKDAVPLWLYLFGVGFFVLTALSFVTSSARNYGFAEVFGLGVLLLFALLVVRGGPKGHWLQDDFFRRIAETLSVTTLIACTIGILVYVFEPLDRFVGSFFDPRFHTDFWPNAWAEYLLLAWPLVVFSLRKLSAIRIAALSIVFSALLLSYSRGALLALVLQLIAGVVLLFILWLKKRDGISKTTILGIVRDVVCITVLVPLLFASVNLLRSQFHPVQSVAEKATFTATEGMSSINERKEFWDAAIWFTEQRPLLGYGPESFRFVQPSVQQHILATSDHPHNVFLKLSMERGIPAMLLFLGIVVAAVFAGLRTFFRAQSEVLRTTTFVALLAVIGVLAHNQIDFNLQFFGILLPFTFLLGVLLRAYNKELNVLPLRKSVEAFLTMFLLLTCVIEGRFLLLSHEARVAEAKGDIPRALALFNTTEGSLLPRDLELTRARLLSSSDKQSEALMALQMYQSQNAHDARAWMLEGNIEESQGRFVAARTSYELAYSHGAFNLLGATRGIVQTSMQLSDTAILKTRKTEFLNLHKAYGQAILQNTHFIALSQSVEEFAIVTKLLLQVYPNDALAIRAAAKGVKEHAAEERKKLKARNPGILW
jgi:O-antigen ligase